MTLLDASGVIGFLTNEPSADAVERLLRVDGCELTPVGIAEVVDRLARRSAHDPIDVVVTLRRLGLLDATPLTPRTAAAAGALRARHYRRTRQVSMADCVLAATARERREPVATSDAALLEMCVDEELDTVVLPASDGGTWERV